MTSQGTRPDARLARRILPIAIVLTWLGPFSMDAYTPGFPAIQAEFATSQMLVQATLSTTLIGLAIGQLIVGTVSDLLGRRLPLMIGLAGYVVATVLCATAWSIEVLLVARLLQGFTAATGIAIARAMGRDTHSGAGLARFYALLTAATAIAPMVGPVAGAAMLEIGLSWRWIFGAIALAGAAGLGLVVAALPETHPGHPGIRGMRGRRAGATPVTPLLRRRPVLLSALVIGLTGAGMIAHLAGLSFLLQEERGLSASAYAAVFAVDAVGLVLANALNSVLVRRWRPERVLQVAVPVALAFATAMAMALRFEAPLPVVLVTLFAFVSMHGFVQPNAIAIGMSVERDVAGRAAGILGVAQFGLAVFSAPLVSIVPPVAGIPSMLVVIMGCLVTAVLVQVGFTLWRPHRRQDEHATATMAPACSSTP